MKDKRDDNRRLSQYNFFKKNHKGQDISITTIILVVLGIAVLVLLILGFTKGWNNFLPWLSGNNADTIQGQCQAACETNSVYEFCSSSKTLKADKKSIFGLTCFFLSEQLTEYGVVQCTPIKCDNIETIKPTIDPADNNKFVAVDVNSLNCATKGTTYQYLDVEGKKVNTYTCP